MSLKTQRYDAYAVLHAFDKQEIFLTEGEYKGFLVVNKLPTTKFIEFDDGGIALSAISSYEVIRQPGMIKESDGVWYHDLSEREMQYLEGGDLN
jgi:hypothetical protein